MKLAEVFPPKGHLQRMYCEGCNAPLDLTFENFSADVSGVEIEIKGLPTLRCNSCQKSYLPDGSRFAIIEHHRMATERGAAIAKATRRKINKNFGFTDVPFLYDPDDYYYIPGLERPFDIGFLTPVFFKRDVLLKYESSPVYGVKFASQTYGEIIGEDFSIPFGINKNGNVVMWLGDIARLPESEQFYLRSENIESDHSIGSEFYDGQIECIYTPASRESRLFSLRSDFMEAFFRKLGRKVAHLDAEVMNLALSFNDPIVDSYKERRHIADIMNKIYLESLDNGALGEIMSKLGLDPKSLGSLKRLQAVLDATTGASNIPNLLSPFYVLYDLRVAYSHLTPALRTTEILKTITDRLGIVESSGIREIYEAITDGLSTSFEQLTEIVKSAV
jgi:hypothetical protein